MKKIILLIVFIVLTTACIPVQDRITEQPTQGATATIKPWTNTPTFTFTATYTEMPTNTPTPTETLTPTITATPTITPTPTFTFPAVKVHTQAHCRYGPSTAYLHAADLYPGDTGTVRGRYLNSAWLHVKFDKLNYWCWVSPSVMDVRGDISTVNYITPDLQRIGSNQYGPPQNVQATRNGNEVTITWNQMVMTEDKDRGYFIEAWVCQDSLYKWWTVSFPNQYTTSYTVRDEPGCAYPSSGEIYTVEKHGYSQPFAIPWPQAAQP